METDSYVAYIILFVFLVGPRSPIFIDIITSFLCLMSSLYHCFVVFLFPTLFYINIFVFNLNSSTLIKDNEI